MSIRSSKKSKQGTVTELNTSKATALVKALSQLLQASGVSKSERKALYAKSHHVSDALIQSVANLAAENGGNILGVSFDVEEARAVLAYASDCKAVIHGTRSFAQRLKDSVLQRREATAAHANVVYGVLSRLVRAPEGKHLVQSFEQMQAHATPRRARRTAKSGASNATSKPAAQATGASTEPTPAPTTPTVVTVSH